MSKREYIFFIEDILENINLIEEFLSNLNSIEELENNKLVLYAVLKAFENIGEATKNIPDDLKKEYPYFWKEISGLRDIIVHHYWGIDMDIIYDIIENELPELKTVVQKILKEIKN